MSDTSPAGSDPLAELIESAAAGDRRAFEELYRLTAAKLFAVCRRILSVRGEAEEALQESYLSIWRGATRFDRERGGAYPWLVALTRNRAIDRLRARGNRESAGSADAALDQARAEFARGVLRREILDCLETLDPRDAGFVATAFFRGDSYADLAAAVGMPLATVKTRIRRALIRLRECLA